MSLISKNTYDYVLKYINCVFVYGVPANRCFHMARTINETPYPQVGNGKVKPYFAVSTATSADGVSS